ncbi:MAG TPA: phosphate-starvation-inducible PsiE family protein [Spongiibacteraceae bacterium]|nr:phosphate-starvation-inducible PsiE family protein [Spongiibacteraceae bacterium]
MSSERDHGRATPYWQLFVKVFGQIVVVGLAFLLVIIVAVILAVIFYLFLSNVETIVRNVDSVAEIQQAALRAFSGVLLVLLGLELIDTVKVYFLEHSVRGELVLLVGLIAMGRHVLEIDLHHIDPLILFGFSTLVLSLAVSYFLIKRARTG